MPPVTLAKATSNHSIRKQTQKVLLLIKSKLFTFIDITVVLTAISMSPFPSTLARDNTSLLSKTKRAFDTTITVRRSA